MLVDGDASVVAAEVEQRAKAVQHTRLGHVGAGRAEHTRMPYLEVRWNGVEPDLGAEVERMDVFGWDGW